MYLDCCFGLLLFFFFFYMFLGISLALCFDVVLVVFVVNWIVVVEDFSMFLGIRLSWHWNARPDLQVGLSCTALIFGSPFFIFLLPWNKINLYIGKKYFFIREQNISCSLEQNKSLLWNKIILTLGQNISVALESELIGIKK